MLRKVFQSLLLLLMLAGLCSCSSKEVLRGTDELLQKAREELPVAEAETIELNYAGLCAKGDLALIWFVSGNEYQAHSFLPMECTIVGEDEYTFERTCKPMERGTDIAVLQWQDGYAFLVNNPQCKAIRITDVRGTQEIPIEKDVYPFLYYHTLLPSEYHFLDAAGEAL